MHDLLRVLNTPDTSSPGRLGTCTRPDLLWVHVCEPGGNRVPSLSHSLSSCLLQYDEKDSPRMSCFLCFGESGANNKLSIKRMRLTRSPRAAVDGFAAGRLCLPGGTTKPLYGERGLKTEVEGWLLRGHPGLGFALPAWEASSSSPRANKEHCQLIKDPLVVQRTHGCAD
jgi:hypothetical protein